MEAASASPRSAISLHEVRKTFAATVAVDNVSFDVPEGKVHALLGENGAGKSTIVKLLSGLILPDTGSFRILGEDLRLTSPRVSHEHGIQTAFQEMSLIKDLTVLDNMLLPYGPRGALGTIRWRDADAMVRQHFADLELGGIDLRAEIRDLDLAVQQKIEIARAMFRKPRILLLDEPTSTLSGPDVDWLGWLIAQAKSRGITTIFISHRLREVRAFCDTLTILRNGQHIATAAVDELDDEDVIRMIIGRSLAQAFPPRPTDPSRFGPEVLGASRLGVGDRLKDVSFSLRQGEILGIAGLQGMGQLELFLGCFGMVEITQGQLAVDGRAVAITSPIDAVRADIGISLLPEDRKTEALFLKLNGRHNVSLPVISRYAGFGLIDLQAEQAAVRRVLAAVNVADRALWTGVGAFSGGNQQKIAIAKWLLAESRVLLLYDPTRGIDVGTKNELYDLMRAFVAAGGAILFYSSEIPELVNLSDRVAVLYRGGVGIELEGDEITEPAIMKVALGGVATEGLAA
ncbi:MAG: ribose transport system ATP-binding protein [Rhodospirillaceae bacterium]|nr:ribose transport system ATP-binding protein [Rhodospirillaceae bacterium]